MLVMKLRKICFTMVFLNLHLLCTPFAHSNCTFPLTTYIQIHWYVSIRVLCHLRFVIMNFKTIIFCPTKIATWQEKGGAGAIGTAVKTPMTWSLIRDHLKRRFLWFERGKKHRFLWFEEGKKLQFSLIAAASAKMSIFCCLVVGRILTIRSSCF
jgi:hypothetical protein